MMAVNIGPGVGAAVIRARKRVLRERRAAGATTAETGVAFAPWRPLERKYLRSLKAFGAVKETADGRLYLDEELVAEHTQHRRKRVLKAGIAAVLMGAIVAGLARA